MTIKIGSRKQLMKVISRRAARRRHAQSVMFELTYRCNFRCPHCYTQGSPEEGSELTTEQIFRVLDQMKDMGVYSIAFTGGEALMREDIFEVLSYAKRAGFQTALLSNGYLIDRSTAAELARVNVGGVDITVNSLDREVLAELTGVADALDKVRAAINLLLDEGVRVKIKSTAMVANRDELVKIGKLARSLNIVYNLDTEVLPCRSRDTRFVERYSLAPDEAEALRRAVYPEMFTGDRPRSRSRRKRDRMFNCGVGRTAFSIDPYGKMNFCLEIDHPRLDILSLGVEECWKRLKEEIDEFNKEKDFVCADCELIHYCGWCPGRSFAETGTFNECSPYMKERARQARKRRSSK